MKEIPVYEYILKEMQNALRLSANILNSRERKTAADRQIEYAERLANWILEGKQGEPPSIIPKITS